MLLNVRYTTNEEEQVSPGVSRYIQRDARLQPLRIIRRPCGEGAAAKRFTYTAIYAAPADARYALNGELKELINRKTNPQFKPNALYWDGDMAIV